MNHFAPEQPQVASGNAGRLAAQVYSLPEWRLLTRLPGRIVVAAVSGIPGSSVPAGLAGLDAIAAGRLFDSDLVRAVVAEIYAESDGDPVADRTAEASGGPAELFESCRTVARLLADRADPADSAVYRQWVQSVAARVGRVVACHDHRPVPDRDDSVCAGFLANLGRALGLSGAL